MSGKGTAARPLRRVVLGLTCVVIALGSSGIAGCGEDDSETTTPTTEPATPTGPTGPTSADEPQGGDDQNGGGGDVDLEDGTVTPPPETDPENLPAAPADSPENDTPPPPGSPAEQFENFCDQNPEACG